MNQLILNNSNPSKLYVGEGQGTFSFLSGQRVFPAVEGSVTFNGNALPVDTTLPAEDQSTNLSVVFSYDTRNNLTVVLQKQNNSDVWEDVETVSVTDTRFSGWDSIAATVDVSQSVPYVPSNVYRFKFTETVLGTEVITLSSLMIVRREPELVLTISPSGDQTVKPGEQLTLTPNFSVQGITLETLANLSQPTFYWKVRKGDNTDDTDLISSLNDSDYSIDSSTNALTITGNLSKAKKEFVLAATIVDSNGGTERLLTKEVAFTVTATDTVGGYRMAFERVGLTYPIIDYFKRQHPMFYTEFAEQEFIKQNGDGGYISRLRLQELSNGNFRASYVVRNPKRNERVIYASHNATIIDNPSAAFVIKEINPSTDAVTDVYFRHDMWDQRQPYRHNGMLYLNYVTDDELTALAYGVGNYRSAGSTGGWGQYFIEDNFRSSSPTKYYFNSETQSSNLINFYSYPEVTKVIKAGNPSRIYAFLEHNVTVGSRCQIIRTEAVAPSTSEVCFITGDYSQGRGVCKISDDFNWVLATRWHRHGGSDSFFFLRMVKTNFLTGTPENMTNNHIRTDGLPEPDKWRTPYRDTVALSGDGSTVAIAAHLHGSEADTGGKVLFYNHDLSGNLSYSSSLDFPLAGNGPKRVHLSYDGTFALVTTDGYSPNYGAQKVILYQRSSSTSSDWVELETPQGLDAEGRRHIMYYTGRTRNVYARESEDTGVAISETGKGMVTQESVYWFPAYKQNGEPLRQPGFYKAASGAQRIKLHLKPST